MSRLSLAGFGLLSSLSLAGCSDPLPVEPIKSNDGNITSVRIGGKVNNIQNITRGDVAFLLTQVRDSYKLSCNNSNNSLPLDFQKSYEQVIYSIANSSPEIKSLVSQTTIKCDNLQILDNNKTKDYVYGKLSKEAKMTCEKAVEDAITKVLGKNLSDKFKYDELYSAMKRTTGPFHDLIEYRKSLTGLAGIEVYSWNCGFRGLTYGSLK